MSLEDKFTDDEIRELWADGFCKRHDDTRAWGLCHMLRVVIEQRAAHTGAREDDLVFELNHVLDTIGIPRAEFY